MFSIIVAHDSKRGIGKGGKLPWPHNKNDMKRFVDITTTAPDGKTNAIIMGRKTWESIGSKPLKDRENIVISRTGSWDNVTVYPSLVMALDQLKNREIVYIGGGSQLYAEALPIADQLVITLVHGSFTGDTFFPDYRNDIGRVWKETDRQDFETHSFIWYDRIRPS
jgi:dihydrofolate reductase